MGWDGMGWNGMEWNGMDGWMDGWMDDLYLNTIKIKATSLWGRVEIVKNMKSINFCKI